MNPRESLLLGAADRLELLGAEINSSPSLAEWNELRAKAELAENTDMTSLDYAQVDLAEHDNMRNAISFLQAKLKALEKQKPVAYICHGLYGAGSRILRWQEPTQSGTLVNAGTIEPLYARAKA